MQQYSMCAFVLAQHYVGSSTVGFWCSNGTLEWFLAELLTDFGVAFICLCQRGNEYPLKHRQWFIAIVLLLALFKAGLGIWLSSTEQLMDLSLQVGRWS